METLRYRNQNYQAPGSWNECTPAMRAKLIPFCRLKPVDINDVIWEMAVQIAFSIPEKPWAAWIMSYDEWDMLKQNTSWVFEIPAEQPYTYFEHKGVRYILPESEFQDTTAIELSMAMISYMDFTHPEEPDTSALNRLVATLCRPERGDLKTFRKSDGWNGDEREPFNEARMMMRAAALEDMELNEKVVILTYFEMQLKGFLQQYEMLFGGESEPRYGDGRGWIMMLKNIAKEGHFGNFDQVSKQNVHLVFAAALDDAITAEEIRDKQDNDE